MFLHGKRLLMLIADGVLAEEIDRFRSAFESDFAEIYSCSPYPFLEVYALAREGGKESYLVDCSLDSVQATAFDGVLIPNGVLSSDLLQRYPAVITLLQEFHRLALPICASGQAVKLLHSAGLVSPQILVRDGSSLDYFCDQVKNLLLDGKADAHQGSQTPVVPLG